MSAALKAMINRHYEALDDWAPANAYYDRHETESALILTIYDDKTAGDVAEYLRPRIEGKIVVEIGAGIGLLACHLAGIARRVYAIESDPAWTSCFLAALYAQKPTNLTFIFGRAQDSPHIAADVALFCTHSGHASLYRNASRFAPTVIDVYAEILAAKAEREKIAAVVAAPPTRRAE